MNVSYKQLKKYVDFNNSELELVDVFNEIGLEVESYDLVCKIENLVVGEIISFSKHPDADKLNVCLVDLGEEIKQIVCGASNVKNNLKVIVAKIGAVMANGLEIKKAVLRGVESNGMLCSLNELGLKEGYINTVSSGIHELPEDAKVGEDVIKYLKLDDYIYDLSITPNKSDCLSYFGLSYDLASKFALKNTIPNVKSLNFIEKKMTLDCTNALYYTIIKDVEVKESSDEMKSFLTKHNIKPRNNIVDLANYVMLTTGQPLHTYDYDKISNDLSVELANDEKLICLDENTYQLSKNNLVVKSKDVIVGIAGIMGSRDSAISENTKNILIESGDFDAGITRISASLLGLRTEASSRFEKPKDPNMIKYALEYYCTLLEKDISECYYMDKRNLENQVVEFSLEQLNKFVGFEFTKKDVFCILDNLQFSYSDEFKVTIPLRRPDIMKFCDLVEEIVRFYGINNIPSILPTLQLKTHNISNKDFVISKIKEILLNSGLNEVCTYSLVSEKMFSSYNFFNLKPVELMLPFSENRKFLRSNLMSSLYEVVSFNKDFKNSDVNIFEIGRVYSEDFKESEHLSFVLYGNLVHNTWNQNNSQVDFYTIKGLIEKLFKMLNIENIKFEISRVDGMHPYRNATILFNDLKIGYVGEILEKSSKIKSYGCEIDLESICLNYNKNIIYKQDSKFPSIKKDMAFLISHDIKGGEMLQFIKDCSNEVLKNVEIFDVFMNENNKSIAFSLEYNDDLKTLTNDEVNSMFFELTKAIEMKFDCKLRDKEV